MIKARLYKGPHNGKIIECDGRTEIIVRYPKKLTRRRRYDLLAEKFGGVAWPYIPYVEATYKMLVRPHPNLGGMSFTNVICIHPDGSYFYQYVEGSKREY